MGLDYFLDQEIFFNFSVSSNGRETDKACLKIGPLFL